MQLPRDDTNHPRAEAFRAFVRDAGFPCVGAKSALTKGQMRVLVARDITSAWDDMRIYPALMAFAAPAWAQTLPHLPADLTPAGVRAADGFLKITDRKNDLFKTSGGKYIAPSSIESQFKAICPFASQFLVHGNDRNYCVALVTLDPDAMAGWAEENGMGGKSYTEIVQSDEVQKMVGGYIDELNSHLNRWETIKKWKLLDHDLTVESGELTPSMKVKRKVVEGNYKEQIDALYKE